MVFSKGLQERIIAEYIAKNPMLTSSDIENYMNGVEKGIYTHIKYLNDFNKGFEI